MSTLKPDMICAPATPEGSSALAVIRLSGEGTSAVVESMMSLDSGRLRGMKRKVGFLRDDKGIIDRVVAVGWPSGRSYTGEEMVEIISHGIPRVTRRILEALEARGVRRAVPGEFTRRAYATGRMGALQVLNLASLWTDVGRDAMVGGAVEKRIEAVLEKMGRTREALEGDIEFSEEHLDGEERAGERLEWLVTELEEFREDAAVFDSGGRVLLMGPVNSGKSTLFNLLTGGDTALVSDEPGTTRDGASYRIEIDGRFVELVDTAGFGGTGLDEVAYKRVVKSLGVWDKVVWMTVEGLRPTAEIADKVAEVVVVLSKSDEVKHEPLGDEIELSSFTGEGIKELKKRISPVPGSLSVTVAAERVLGKVKDSLRRYREGDLGLSAFLLGEAERELADMLGKGHCMASSIEKALSTLCVGK